MGNNTARSKRSEDDGDVIAHRRNSGKVLPAGETNHLQHNLPGFIPSATNSRRSTPQNPETQESIRDVANNSPLKTVFCSTPVWPHFLPPVDELFGKEEAIEKKNEVAKKVIPNSPLASPNLQEHIREIRSIVSMDSDRGDDIRETRSRGKSSGQVSKSAVERRSSDQEDVLPSMPQRAAVSERILSVHMREELERPRAPQMPPANRRRSSLRSGIYSNRIHNSNSTNNNLRDNQSQSKKDDDDWNYQKPNIEGFDINKFKEVNGQQQTMTKGHNHDFGSPVRRTPDVDIDSPLNRKPLVNGFFKTRSNSNSTPVNPLSYDITEEELIASIEKEFDI